MVRVFARAKSKPGDVDALRDVLRKLVAASRAEEGVVTYDLFESADGTFLFREEYADDAAFEKHKTSRHIAVGVGRATPLMDGLLDVWVVKAVE